MVLVHLFTNPLTTQEEVSTKTLGVMTQLNLIVS